MSELQHTPDDAPIPNVADDVALLQAAIWSGLTFNGSERRRCHVRNLASRGLLRRLAREQRWELTAAGWRAIG
jgi:hypothetical protein